VLVAACAALVTASPAAAADRMVERGIIQSVDTAAVVLRALDGTEITVAVGPETRFRLNGRATTFDAIQPGLVAEAVRSTAGQAVVIRAFGSAGRTETGRLVRVRPRALVLRRGFGDTVRIPVTARTTVWRAGGRMPLRILRRGMNVEIVLGANGAARVVLVRRAGA
jgi:hypothetical protein